MNNWIRSLLFNPTALAIPSSVDLAAANSTNTRKISSIPTMIENDPNIEKMVVTPVATVSANSSPFFLSSITLSLLNEENIIEVLPTSSFNSALLRMPDKVSCV